MLVKSGSKLLSFNNEPCRGFDAVDWLNLKYMSIIS